jgi:hypothetical protein
MKLVGQLIYNGIAFGGSSQITLQQEMVRDEADRTTTYVRSTLTCRSVLYDSNDTGGSFLSARSALEMTGGELIFSGQGAGNIHVNGSGVIDLKFGPKPRVLVWSPLGSLRACEVVWTCEFCLPYDGNLGTYSLDTFLAFNYGISYSIDTKGSTTRTISGYLEVPQTRVGRYVTKTADTYRTYVNPAVPSEFKRTQKDFRVSPDKSRLDFTITDEEIPSDNPYPAGVANIDARHVVMWSKGARGSGFLRNRITAEIELGFDQPIENAYAIFLHIAYERIKKARDGGHNILIDDISVEEGIFDRKTSFSVSYRFTYLLYKLIFDKIPAATGIFSKLTSVPTWSGWATSMASAFGVGGYQNLTSPAAADRILDVSGGSSIPWAHSVSPGGAFPSATVATLENVKPESGHSWIDFDCWIEIQRDCQTTRQTVLQTAPAVEVAASMETGADTVLTYPDNAGTADIIQTSGQPQYKAIISGWAKRAGWHIPRPNWRQIGNATATEKHQDFSEKLTGICLGVEIYTACWRIEYDLDQSPGQVLTRDNLEAGIKDPGEGGAIASQIPA